MQILSDKGRQKHVDRQEGRRAERRGELTDPEDIWRDLLINVKEFSVYDTIIMVKIE